MNKVDEMYATSRDAAAFAEQYGRYVSSLLQQLDCGAIAQVVRLVMDTRDRGKTTYFMGNGGSAATASHFANDFSIGLQVSDQPFRAVSLADNNAMVTCIANDFGYSEIFKKQLELFLTDGDLVVAMSASGNSPNVVSAVEYANARGNHTVGFVGFDGGKLKQVCEVCVHVETAVGEYGPVEDLHMVLDHLMTSFIYRATAQTR